MIFGVTGQHQLLSTEESVYVRHVVKRWVVKKRKNHTLVSGMAFGVDTEAILGVWGLIPFENIICVVPGTAPHNYGLVDQCEKAGAVIIKCDTLHTVGKTYLHRDDVAVEQITPKGTLLAFPRQTTFYRSGTWATINRAKKVHTRVRMYPLTNAQGE